MGKKVAAKIAQTYRIEGRGGSENEADERLDSEITRIQGLISDAGLGAALDVARDEFTVGYVLREGVEPTSVRVTSFTVRSPRSWGELRETAAKHGDVALYTGSFAHERYLNLSAEQQRAVSGERRSKPPTAYRGAGKSSSLDRLRFYREF